MGKGRPLAHPKRGELWLVNFDPTQGAEIQKTRPALVLQNDIGNARSPITIVAAISSKFDAKRLYPTEVLVGAPEGGLTADSVVQLNQVRSVDKARLQRRLGELAPETMTKVESALLISFGLKELGVLHAFLKQAGIDLDDLLKRL